MDVTLIALTLRKSSVARKLVMNFDEISAAARQLGYRDKLRLAQLVIQIARREEEQEHPGIGTSGTGASPDRNPELIAERIRKLRPRTRTALMNSIDAMYQFRGGISENDRDKVVEELDRDYGITIDRDGRVSYSD